MRVIAEFHENRRVVKGANNSFIVLIPKKRNSVQISYYIPISLIGCIYKVFTKVLTNIIKKMIGLVISEPRSAFMSGREILDGILIENEIVVKPRRRKKEVFVFKFDFEKAYDSVDWNFLDYLMLKWDFTINGGGG